MEAHPGSLAVVDSCDGKTRRMAIVTDVDADVCRVQLVTNYLEMATDFDMRVTESDTGFPTTLLIQPELYGSIFPNQIVRIVGAIAPELVAAVKNSLASDGESVPIDRSGLPLGWLDDPRRAFKEEELDDLVNLVKECRQRLIEEIL